MIKSFEKLKVRIDQNLNRGEKSEALTEDVVKIKNKVTCLKQVMSIFSQMHDVYKVLYLMHTPMVLTHSCFNGYYFIFY